MLSVGEISATLRLRDELTANLQTVKKGLDSFGGAALKAGGVLSAALTVPIAAAGFAVAKLGMEAVESKNLIEVSFGDMAKASHAWAAKLSDDLGLNRYETEKTAAVLFTMTSNMGLTKEAAFDMSTGVVQLAADMASFRNIPMEEALLKIQAGLVGEAEPLKRIGILVTENTTKAYAYASGIAKEGEELNETQKVMARWGSILKQTSKDQGDLARTLESPANQLRIMKERITEAATQLGVSLLPVIQRVTSTLASAVPYLQAAVKWFAALPEPVQRGAVIVLALVAALGPLLVVVGGVASGISALIPLLPALGAVMAVATGPIGLIAAAVIGVTAAIMLFRQRLGEALQQAQPHGKAITAEAQAMADMRTKAVALAAAMPPLQNGMSVIIGPIQKAAGPDGFAGLTNKIAAAEAELSKLSATQRTQLAAALKAGVSDMDALKKATGLSEGAIKLFEDQMEVAGKAATKLNESLERLRLSKFQLGQAAVVASQNVRGFTIRISDVVAISNDYSKTLTTAQIKTDSFGHVLKTNAMPSLEGMGGAAAQAALRLAALGSESKTLGEVLKDSLTRIPDLVKSAFTGGGGMLGAIKAISVEIAEGLLKNLSAAQQKIVGMGSAAAAALGSKAGGMGATVAGVASSLGGAALAASAWGTSMAAAGVAGSVALGAATMGVGLAAVAVYKLWKNWKDHKEMVEANNKSLTEFQASIWATLSAEQVAEAGGREWAATVIGVRDAYLATGRTGEQALADVKAMWDSTTQSTEATRAAMDRVNQAFIEQRQQAENFAKGMGDLNEIAKKYNITIEEMGPAWQKQELEKKAQELYKDYKILISAGLDHTLVITKMADGINEYVKNALRTGTEVPEAMREMIEEMIRTGQLLDENGNKITDLEASGISFSMTMSEGFKTLIDEVKKLTTAIAKGLGLSLDILTEKTKEAGETFKREFDDAGDAVADLNDKVDDLNFGHSPGGLKEIPILLGVAKRAFDAFGVNASGVLKGTEAEVNKTAKGIGKLVIPPWMKKLDPSLIKDTTKDLERDLALLRAPSDDARERMRLTYDKQDELAGLLENRAKLGASYPILVAMVMEKFAILLANLKADQAKDAGFASGTGGKFLDFGSGTSVTLHGKERVMTEAEGRAAVVDQSGVIRELRDLKSELRWQRRTIPLAIRDTLQRTRAM